MIQNRPLIVNRGEAFLTHLRSHLYQEQTPIAMTVYHAPDRISFNEAMQGGFLPLKIGDTLAPNWSTHWVKVEFKTAQNSDLYPWHLRWHSRSEACVWQAGEPLQAFSPDHRTAFPLPTALCNGKTQILYIEVAVNNLFGVEHFVDRMPWLGKGIGLVEMAEIARFREDIFQLLMDFLILFEIAKQLPETTQRAQDAIACMNEVINIIFFEDPKSIQLAREKAHTFLDEKAALSVHQLSAIGHAHIDLAWLWPVAESKRKIYRTLSTALANMERYPEFMFICSQMQIWAWIKDKHPVLYKKMIEKVKSGQLIACGGSWVEPDCNLPSLESLLRQFIFGQRFMQKEFGFKSKVFWNPDVFGYSAQLPQILKQCSMDYFLTQKMSWNQYNRFPHSSFIWEGLDGSQVLAHFPPADNYNCSASVEEVLFNVKNHKSGDRTRESYMLYGFGDGGGGPTEEMIERIRRMKNIDGLPQVEHRTPNDFFARLKKDDVKLSTWVGELYLELHRGCQTTQALNKWYNRKCEQLLREVEQLYGCYDIENYPLNILKSAWELLLLNQFHDILPGSSIQEAYTVSQKEYKQLFGMLSVLKEKALLKITQKKGKNLLVFNPNYKKNKKTICVLPKGFKGAQQLHTGETLALISTEASLGYEVISLDIDLPKETVTARKKDRCFFLENQFVCAKFDHQGHLISFYDKLNTRECVEKSAFGNDLRIYDDQPNYWDAWDIEAFYREKMYPAPSVEKIQIIDKGPLRARLSITYKISEKSSFQQWISLDATSPLLTFQNKVQWYEKHRLLKVEFPWDIRTQQAAYEIQGGFICRHTHDNTSWQMAQFEVCGHRWADLASADYGVALLNDSKYGYHTLHNRMTLSLLRGCTYPDPEADEGEHHFIYAIYPHASPTANAQLHQVADELNMPVAVYPTHLSCCKNNLLKLENGDNLSFVAVKKAEESDDLIIRFYEACGMSHDVSFVFDASIKAIYRTNALEEKQEKLRLIKGRVTLAVKPFEIITLQLKK